MNEVNFDFELLSEDGSSLGNCAEFISVFGNLLTFIELMNNSGHTDIASQCEDARQQWQDNKTANMEDPQYTNVKNFFIDFSGLFPSPKSQILAKFLI